MSEADAAFEVHISRGMTTHTNTEGCPHVDFCDCYGRGFRDGEDNGEDDRKVLEAQVARLREALQDAVWAAESEGGDEDAWVAQARTVLAATNPRITPQEQEERLTKATAGGKPTDNTSHR